LIALILSKDYCNVKQGFVRLQNRNKKMREVIGRENVWGYEEGKTPQG
jgi:hypothetical protein